MFFHSKFSVFRANEKWEHAKKKKKAFHIILAPRACLSVSVSMSLSLPWLFLFSPCFSSACCSAIKSEVFLLLMHTNAQHLTGADSMKREAAEINTYVMKEKRPPNDLPICACQRRRSGCIDI